MRSVRRLYYGAQGVAMQFKRPVTFHDIMGRKRAQRLAGSLFGDLPDGRLKKGRQGAEIGE